MTKRVVLDQIGRPMAVLALLCSLLVLAEPAPVPAAAAPTPAEFEQCLLQRINASRAQAGAVPVALAPDVSDGARDWSSWMSDNEFRHMTSAERDPILPPNRTTWAENIARHGSTYLTDCSAIHTMFMNSPGHRANILNPNMRFVGLGAHLDGGGWWVTELFFAAPGYSVACDGTFCDDDDSVFEPAIEAVAAAGITRGCNPPANTDFCPGDRVTRGQLAAFLTRALNLQPAGPSFADTADSVFADDIRAVAAAGITRGCNPPDNDLFCPDEYVTRGQMAAFLARALPLPSGGPTFDDTADSIFENDIRRLAAADITRGCNPPDNDLFCPDEAVTRGQMAAFIARALGL